MDLLALNQLKKNLFAVASEWDGTGPRLAVEPISPTQFRVSLAPVNSNIAMRGADIEAIERAGYMRVVRWNADARGEPLPEGQLVSEIHPTQVLEMVKYMIQRASAS